jgi:hypothetical protein
MRRAVPRFVHAGVICSNIRTVQVGYDNGRRIGALGPKSVQQAAVDFELLSLSDRTNVGEENEVSFDCRNPVGAGGVVTTLSSPAATLGGECWMECT